jgi:signal peptidase I
MKLNGQRYAALIAFHTCLQILTVNVIRSCHAFSSVNPIHSRNSNLLYPTVLAVSSSTGEATSSLSYLPQWNGTLAFPSCNELLCLEKGDCITSQTLTVTALDGNKKKNHRFCVKLYPRGGGHPTKQTLTGKREEKSGFGMSYRVLPMFGTNENEKLGAYLMYLPESTEDSVDASFWMRLKGNQLPVDGRKFDVEWRSGMRFVSKDDSKLAEGRANDFGAHLMQTQLLTEFLGADLNEPLQMQVGITIHDSAKRGTDQEKTQDSVNRLEMFQLGRDIRHTDASSSTAASKYVNQNHEQHDSSVRVGRVVVPVLQKLSQRPRMFQLGVYPGVEYRIMRVIDPSNNDDLFYSRPGADYELKPIYPLVAQLEREWPVRVNEREIPKLYTPAMYNILSAIGSLITAASALVTAFVISQAVSLFVIPSLSMDPTLQVNDVLLVEKVTPRLNFRREYPAGSVVLFHPPPKLQELLYLKSGRYLSDRDLFVKRVAAVAGDTVNVNTQGLVTVNGQDVTTNKRDLCTTEPLRLIEQYIEPHSPESNPLIVPSDQVAVLGDCSFVSMDSRVWGTLPVEQIVGRPLLRLWPLSRFGPISNDIL